MHVHKNTLSIYIHTLARTHMHACTHEATHAHTHTRPPPPPPHTHTPQVHYKEAPPPSAAVSGSSNSSNSSSCCSSGGVASIVMIHGFGGGVNSWRHIMDPLARQVGCVTECHSKCVGL